MGPALCHLHTGARVGQPHSARTGIPGQVRAQTHSHLTSKVGQPPNPCNWHLPLPSPLTELEGQQRAPSGNSEWEQGQPSGAHAAPSPSPPPKTKVCRAAPPPPRGLHVPKASRPQHPRRGLTPAPPGTTTGPAPGPSQTHHLLVGLALGARLGLPGLLNVLGCKAPHRGLVLVEEPSLQASGTEGGSAIYKKPPIPPAQRRGSLPWEPGFPKGSTVSVGRSWALAAGVILGWRRRLVLGGGCREVCRGALGPWP